MKKIVGGTATMLLLAACATSPVREAATATATLRPLSGSQVQGQVKFTQVGPNRVRVSGEVTGHQPGQKGFHIHETGDCSAPDGMSAGGHFNPNKTSHGVTPAVGHAGDMGNLTFSDAGRATIDTTFEGLTVSSDATNGIIGRAVIVHMGTDDLKTDPSGNSGSRAACGIIG